jgi:uncharacterized membrane protein
MTVQAVQFVAAFCTAIFAGAASYISIVEHPARMLGDARVALAQWVPSYKRATFMQVPLALVGLLMSIVAWLLGSPAGWLVAGLLIGAVVPFTLIVIMPTNHALQALSATESDGDSPGIRELLDKWSRLHAVRTVLSLLALMLQLWQICRI